MSCITTYNLDSRARRQEGVALVVAMVVLLVMTLLGVSAVNVTSLELRVVGNTQNRNIVAQTADSVIDQILFTTDNNEDRANLAANYDVASLDNGTQKSQLRINQSNNGNLVKTTSMVLYVDGTEMYNEPSAPKPIDCPGSSLSFSCIGYEIRMTVTHEKSNASATYVQGLVKTGPKLEKGRILQE